METLTIAELIEQLQSLPQDARLGDGFLCVHDEDDRIGCIEAGGFTSEPRGYGSYGYGK